MQYDDAVPVHHVEHHMVLAAVFYCVHNFSGDSVCEKYKHGFGLFLQSLVVFLSGLFY